MKHRGIALVTTLMVMALLTTLTGAFMSIHKASSTLTGNALQRRSAQDACLTGLHLAWSKLEQNPDWGKAGHFSVTSPVSQPSVHPVVQWHQDYSGGQPVLVGSLEVDGQFGSSSAATFEVKIYNNLGNRVTLPGAIPVPARSVRLMCTARNGSTVRHLDTILRQKPLSYESLAAGRNAQLSAGTATLLRIESRDPYVNRVRAGDNLEMPGANAVKFLKHGTASSEDQLRVGTEDLATATADRVAEVNQLAGGVFQPGVAPPTAPPFEKENFKLPANESQVPSGTYVFGGINREEYRGHQINYDNPSVNPMTGEVEHNYGSVMRYQRATSVYDQLTDPNGKVYVAKDSRVDSTVLDPPTVPTGIVGTSDVAESWGYDSTPDQWENGANPVDGDTDVHEIATGVYANVATAQMAVRSGTKVKASGNFEVQALGDRKPEMLFGYNFTSGGVAEQESLVDGIQAALDHPEQHMAALEADGSVSIPGGVIGYGSMVAGGDMAVKASSGLRAAPELGVVVKARNLTIDPADQPEPHLPGEPVSMDYPVFQQAISSFAGSDWSQFDNWLSHSAATRGNLADQMKTISLSSPPATYWNQLNTELGTSYPMPALGAGWGSGNATVEQYLRLKEFIQTLASGYNGGQGDLSWLDMNQHANDARARLENTVSGIAQWAKSYNKTMQAYLAAPEPEVPDMFYQGLLYADQDLTVNANGGSFRLEGAMVSGHNTNINGASSIDLVYDRSLVDDQMVSNVAGGMKLEQIFFVLR
jgi:hypothetical protein